MPNKQLSIQDIVDKQVSKVLKRGSRMSSFDQIRQRHFWSTYLFVADPSTNRIAAGAYDLFKTIPGASGQGYPTNLSLTVRETNWLNAGRVPDNQNFAIMELGVTIRNPPLERIAAQGAVDSSGIFNALTAAQQAYITRAGAARPLAGQDMANIAMGGILEMSFLTNNVPLGLLADFTQSAGIVADANQYSTRDVAAAPGAIFNANMANGIPAAAFRRKLEIPISLQHGENMGMRIVFPRPVTMASPAAKTGNTEGGGGTGWCEIRVDWWAVESFTEKS
jgi:hypothetical protein